MNWRQALADEGVTVDAVDHHHVRLIDEASSVTRVVLLRAYRQPISSSKIPPLDERAGLLVVPRGTDAFFHAARQGGWSVAADSGELDVTVGRRHILRRHEDQPIGKRRTGRTPWPLFTTGRVLGCLATAPLPGASVTQEILARIVGTSQPTINRAVRRLAEHGLLSTTRGRLHVPDPDALTNWWIENYPGPGGVTAYWYSLASPAEQARAAVALLTGGRSRTDPVVSGQVAADLLAPWQRPDRVQIYARKAVPLAAAGFVAVAAPEDATLTVTVPADAGIWLRSPWPATLLGARVDLADPLQVLYDVASADDPTAAESGDRLRNALRTTLAEKWRQTRAEVMM